MRHLAAFWLVAVAGLCSYLRCATWLGARYYEGWLFGGMTSGCDGCIGPRLFLAYPLAAMVIRHLRALNVLCREHVASNHGMCRYGASPGRLNGASEVHARSPLVLASIRLQVGLNA